MGKVGSQALNCRPSAQRSKEPSAPPMATAAKESSMNTPSGKKEVVAVYHRRCVLSDLAYRGGCGPNRQPDEAPPAGQKKPPGLTASGRSSQRASQRVC